MEILLARITPAIFVLLWSSGFVVARLVRPFAEPESFVSLRFALSGLVLAGIAWIARAPWPKTPRGWVNSLAAGALMQGVYVGGVFWAVKHGLPAAEASLISGLQPPALWQGRVCANGSTRAAGSASLSGSVARCL